MLLMEVISTAPSGAAIPLNLAGFIGFGILAVFCAGSIEGGPRESKAVIASMLMYPFLLFSAWCGAALVLGAVSWGSTLSVPWVNEPVGVVAAYIVALLIFVGSFGIAGRGHTASVKEYSPGGARLGMVALVVASTITLYLLKTYLP